jgi:uncharacterized membrane-anchored protein YitT (DUF2179 family)
MLSENCTNTTGQCDRHHAKCVSWSAIFVGAFVGIGLGFLLNLFGFSIGLSLLTTTQAGMLTLAVGGFVGLLINVIVSMFLAGTTAGYLARPYCAKRNLGVVYGFTTWCVGFLLSVLFASHIMHFVANYTMMATHQTVANQAVVTVTDNQAMPAVTAAVKDSNTSMVIVNAQKATNTVGYVSFLVFVLFIVGALASCLGGCYGMRRLCKNACCGKCGCTTTACHCGSGCKK